MKKYDLAAFELSQAYLFFWDKLEKANYFLENVLETSEEALDGRLVQTLMQSPVGDGGQWDMVANLVNKYGLVRDLSITRVLKLLVTDADLLGSPSPLSGLFQCHELFRHGPSVDHYAPRSCSSSAWPEGEE